jgi:ubiquinone/menaquinone biosynthesis C-methylase UbiE
VRTLRTAARIAATHKMAAVMESEPLASEQSQTDERNAAFWDELCGTGLARDLGIETIDPGSLRRFDDAYMAFYPYLWQYLELDRIQGRRVLEIGLGFGTVGELLAAAGAVYHGVDIAGGPVEMMRERLRMKGLDGVDRVQQASALALPYEDGTFDRVYTIGCLHHTGDTPKGVSEVYRVLAPGGRAVVMLYNAHALRQMTQRARAKLQRRPDADKWLDSHYDVNTAGDVAPHIDYASRGDVRRMFRDFERVRIESQNFDDFQRGRLVLPRAWFLKNLARVVGVDLYIVADKRAAG